MRSGSRSPWTPLSICRWGCIHRPENTGTELLRIIEVQIGSYTGEDDIERLEDIYGRVSS
jgi:mannose-6-phosphate isomerase-like protein (cupin superfamily)